MNLKIKHVLAIMLLFIAFLLLSSTDSLGVYTFSDYVTFSGSKPVTSDGVTEGSTTYYFDDYPFDVTSKSYMFFSAKIKTTSATSYTDDVYFIFVVWDNSITNEYFLLSDTSTSNSTYMRFYLCQDSDDNTLSPTVYWITDDDMSTSSINPTDADEWTSYSPSTSYVTFTSTSYNMVYRSSLKVYHSDASIYYHDGSDRGDVLFRSVGVVFDNNNLYASDDTDSDDNSSESDNSGWFSSIINFLSNIFNAICDLASAIASAIGTLLELIFEPLFSFIAWFLTDFIPDLVDGIFDIFADVIDAVPVIADYLNPFSDNFILSDVIDFFSELVSYVNPFSDNFFGKTLIEWLKDMFISLFVPDDDYYANKLADLQEQLDEKTSASQGLEILEEIGETYKDYEVDDIDIDVDFNGYYITDDVAVSTSNFIDFSFLTEYKDTWYSWIRVFVYIALIFYNCNELLKLLSGKVFMNGSGKSPDSYNVMINDNALNGDNGRKLLNK